MRDKLISGLRVLVGITGASTAAIGLWATIAPRGWYDTFPGFGRHWLVALGPYNEHFARDAGAGLMAVGVLLTWAALTPSASLLRPALWTSLVFAVPHLGYHIASSDHLATGDNIVNLMLLSLAVVAPAALLWASRPVGEGNPRTSMELDGMRMAAVSPADGGPFLRLAYRYSRRRYGTVLGPLAPLSHHPTLLRGTAAMEWALQHSGEVDWKLKDLAATRAGSMVGCEFCVDFGNALLQREGLPPEQIAELPRWRESQAFSPLEKLVLEYTEALTRTPVEVPDDLYARMREHFTEAQLVELTAAIAFENHRARLYRPFGVGSHGFAGMPEAPAGV
ncbi:MAG TPA: carboxymuconolactone decarboxylase family protein [Candidatus Dormibacteraeota bacterium]|nr:carboxymuconolactone decarboxylase family protein [Candidatus Dormibacteraeota bacterium]